MGMVGFQMWCNAMMLCCWLAVGLIEKELVEKELGEVGREGTVS